MQTVRKILVFFCCVEQKVSKWWVRVSIVLLNFFVSQSLYQLKRNEVKTLYRYAFETLNGYIADLSEAFDVLFLQWIGWTNHAVWLVLGVETEVAAQERKSLLQFNRFPLKQQIHRLLLFLLRVPLDWQQELDKHFFVFLLTVAVAPEKPFLLLV